ncbi:MAG: hypothetical protein ABI858_00005, partial [Pseudoxanthomonas sp.]
MKLQRLVACTLALLLSACAHAPERTLYQELGGQEGVEQVVELLLTRISDDPRIAQQFASVDILNLNDKLELDPDFLASDYHEHDDDV